MRNKNQSLFDANHQDTDLKKSSLRSGAVTLSSQGLLFVIQLGSTMIMARILTPRDYGVMEMVVAVTGLAGMFGSLGLSTATIQRAEISHAQVSTLFWINAAVGALISIIVASLAPVVAWFYKEPELIWVMLALSSNFFASSLVVQHQALLTRQMRFYSLAKVQVLSMLLGVVVALVTARNGLGYWALVLNSIVSTAATVVGTWLASGWIPSLPRRSSEVLSMVRFGSNILGFNIINYFSRNLDNVLIGRYCGSASLGLYSKAYQLLMMPITNLRDPLTSVAMPSLSQLQHDPEQYRNYYMKFISLLAFISMPLVMYMAICSDQLIGLLLGPQWLGASELFRILAIAAFLQPVSSTLGMVLISTGRSRTYLIMGLINAVIVSLSFALGLPWGARGVATAYALVNYLVLIPNLIYVFRGTSIRIKDFILAFYKPLIASFVMGGGCRILLCFMDDLNIFIVITISFVACVGAYILAFVAIAGGGRDLREYYSYGRLIFERK